MSGKMTYTDCMQQLSKDEVFEGLLGYGLFSDRLPSFLTSEAYLNYAKTTPFINNQYDSRYIYYDNYRNNNVPRILAIPTPFAYENLCRVISDNWDKIQDYFKNKTGSQKYKISRIHIRKLAKTNALFKMNYDNWKIDGFPEPDLLLDKKYIVKADIANCFPSMYTHSLPWALVGKVTAKQNMHNDTWYNRIDSFSQKIKDKETHGFLIGPHVSNLLAEIILCDIDNKLCNKWSYIRKIDDYTCFVKTKDEADEFLLDLLTELKNYDLLLNQKKISISELPKSSENDWTISLNKADYLLSSNAPQVKYTNIQNYFDTVIGLVTKYNNSSILNYAFKVVSGHYSPKSKKSKKFFFTPNAISYLKKITIHYTLIYPYLIQFFEETIIIPFKLSKDEIKQASDLFYNEGMNKRNYELCSYAILFSIKNKTMLDNFNVDKIKETNHCILLLLAYIYCNVLNLKNDKKELKKYAKLLSSNKEDFDRNWLFVYEVLPETDLHNEYKPLKRAKISFIDDKKLTYSK